MLIYDYEVNNRFGIMTGEKRIVYIKTGRGGTIYGYHNKYVDIAQDINSEYGYAVVVSANPIEEECDLENEMNSILSACSEVEDILYIGYSNGAAIGAQQGYKISLVKNMLLINGPLMVNWPKTKAGIEKFKGLYVQFVYGSEDPSAQYAQMISFIDSQVCSLEITEGADHRFSGREQDFKRLIIDFVGNH